MNLLLILLISLLLLYLGYRIYGRYIEKVFKVDGSNITPAEELNDGVDYIPTRKFVLFGHHFSSIAGGGPIVGPTVALIFGFLPVWLWLLFGSILIGTVHDFTALLTSMREKGKSIAEIAEKSIGKNGFIIFIAFTLILLLMVTSVFLILTSTALSSMYPVEYFGKSGDLLETVVKNGVEYAVVGGIASTSVIFITLLAPVIGYLLYKMQTNLTIVSLLAIGVCLVSIAIGLYFPLHINSTVWMVILSIYTLIAAGLPVWLILQSRDFINSFLLYGGLIFIVVAAIIAGLAGGTIESPMMNIEEGNRSLGMIWPILFITVACGAISGFHALVVGGTTSKQISNEKSDARTIGYGAMILEAILAIGVIIALGFGLEYAQYTAIVFPQDTSVNSNPILAYALGMGGLLNKAFGFPILFGTIFGILMVEGFVVTTLDTAVRLNRYLLDELWQFLFKNPPKILKTYFLNSFLCVAFMFLLAYFNAFKELWHIFGTANQLLASLTLIVVSVWLYKKGRAYFLVVLPGLFMISTSIGALLYLLFNNYIPNNNYLLIIGDIVLLVLAILVVFLGIRSFLDKKKNIV